MTYIALIAMAPLVVVGYLRLLLWIDEQSGRNVSVSRMPET